MSGGGGGGGRISTDGLHKIDTEAVSACRKAFDDAMKEYKEHKNDIKNAVEILLDHWEGDGRKAFEKDYKLLTTQLEDLMDVLLDLRKGIVDAEASFIEADASLSKSIASS